MIKTLVKKKFSLILGTIATFAFVSFGAWTFYQRTINEKLLTSAQEVIVKLNDVSSIEALYFRKDNVNAALFYLNKIPPNAGDIYEKAKEMLTDLEKLNFQAAELYVKRAATRSDVDNQGAIEDFDQALKYHPNYAEAYLGRSMVHLKNVIVNHQDWQKARQDLQAARQDLQKAAELFGEQGDEKQQNLHLTRLKELDEVIAIEDAK